MKKSIIMGFVFLMILTGSTAIGQVSNVTITYPNRHTILDWSCQEIFWTLEAPNVQFLFVEISTDFGQSWWQVDWQESPGAPDNLVWNDGYLTFHPSQCFSEWNLLKLSNGLNPDDFTISEPFTVVGPRPIILSLTSPTSGDRFVAGTTMEMTWESNYFTSNPDYSFPVDIQYTIDGGHSWITIEKDAENDGYYKWLIPTELASSNISVRLYHWEGGFTFQTQAGPLTIDSNPWETFYQDVSATAGIDIVGTHRSASWVDMNSDGWLDLFCTGGTGNPNILYFGEPTGIFRRMYLDPEVEATGSDFRAAVFADIDNDGYQDAYLGGGEGTHDKLYRTNDDGGFIDITEQAGILAHDEETNGVAFFDYNLDGFVDIFVCKSGMENLFYYNNGDGTFTEIAVALGIAGDPNAFTASVAVGDYDRDGDSDFYVVNSSVHGNTLYRNNGNGTFSDVTPYPLLLDGYNSKSAIWGDYNTDGLLDIYVTRRFFSNVLVQYRYDRTFEDVSTQSGAADDGDGVMMATGDFDGDGRLDICMGNRINGAPEEMHLFIRNGEGGFSDLGHISGIDPVDEPRAAAVGDYDNDGDLDILMPSLGGQSKLFENKLVNQSNKHWLKIRLIGVDSNRDAIGARIMAHTHDVWQMREIRGGSGYGGQDGKDVLFGLGDLTSVDGLAVYWPSGMRHTFSFMEGDSVHVIQEIPDSVVNALAGSLTLTGPEEGSQYKTESDLQIAWQSSGAIDSVLLEFSSDSGVSWLEIAKTENDGIYDWLAPRSVHSSNCQIRISDASDGVPADTSQTFQIEVPPVPMVWEAESTILAGTSFTASIQLGNADSTLYSLQSARAVLTYNAPDTVIIPPDSVSWGEMWGTNPTVTFQVDTAIKKITVDVQRPLEQGGFDGFGQAVAFKIFTDAETPNGAVIHVQVDSLVLTDSAGVLIPSAGKDCSVTIQNQSILVWPGDTDNDGVVNAQDVLPLGLHWGMTGFARSPASSDWNQQESLPWTNTAMTYSDCDGDGVIDLRDLVIIDQNWGSTHESPDAQFPVGLIPTGIQLKVVVNSHVPFEPFSTDIQLTNGEPLFGASFVLHYDTEKVQVDSVLAGDVWGDDTFFLARVDSAEGEIHVGITQKQGLSAPAVEGNLVRVWMDVLPGVGENIPVIFRIDGVEAIDSDGGGLQLLTQDTGFLTSVEGRRDIPKAFRLEANYPNPFNPVTTMTFQMPEHSHVVLRVFDMRGREVRTLVDEERQAGTWHVEWDGRDNQGLPVSSGIYFYRIKTARNTATRKCIFMK